MGLIDRFITSFRSADRGIGEPPGLVQNDDGTVDVIRPDGTRGRIGNGGSIPVLADVLAQSPGGDGDAGGHSIINVHGFSADSGNIDFLNSQNEAHIELETTLDAAGSSITGLPTPTNSSDAATKAYVDNGAGNERTLANTRGVSAPAMGILSLSNQDGAVSIDISDDGVSIASTIGDKLGFHGTTPIVQQTGVAVDAASIHAALVALGLITA